MRSVPFFLLAQEPVEMSRYALGQGIEEFAQLGDLGLEFAAAFLEAVHAGALARTLPGCGWIV